MIAFPILCLTPAKEAGILVPDDIEIYRKEDYPHWHVYTTMQLGRSMPQPDSHFANARIIAAISHEDIMKVTVEDLREKGFEGL